MAQDKTAGFTFEEGLPPDVIAITAHGRITRADYERDLIPRIEARIRQEGKVKLLYEFGADFAGFSAGAAWDDARLGLLHLGDFARLAVVADEEWIRIAVKMFAPLLPCPVRLFHLSERAAAREWICAAEPDRPNEPGVDVTHKIPPLEDKMPPDA